MTTNGDEVYMESDGGETSYGCYAKELRNGLSTISIMPSKTAAINFLLAFILTSRLDIEQMGMCGMLVRASAASFAVASLTAFMVAMVTNNWRENNQTVLPNQALQVMVERKLNISKYTWKSSHGLWWKCVNPPNKAFRETTEALITVMTGQKTNLTEGCEAIKKDPKDTARTHRGNAVRVMVGFAIIFSFIALVLEIGRMVCLGHKVFSLLVYLCSLMAFLCGVIGMAIFTKYYSPCYVQAGDWRQYGWSYYVGWSGVVLMFFPSQMYLGDMLIGKGSFADHTRMPNSYPMN